MILQVYFLDRFFGYQFSTYGTDVLRISELPIEERVDPMSKVFPKVRTQKTEFSLQNDCSTISPNKSAYLDLKQSLMIAPSI